MWLRALSREAAGPSPMAGGRADAVTAPRVSTDYRVPSLPSLPTGLESPAPGS